MYQISDKNKHDLEMMARELVNFGDSKEKCYGNGIYKVLHFLTHKPKKKKK